MIVTYDPVTGFVKATMNCPGEEDFCKQQQEAGETCAVFDRKDFADRKGPIPVHAAKVVKGKIRRRSKAEMAVNAQENALARLIQLSDQRVSEAPTTVHAMKLAFALLGEDEAFKEEARQKGISVGDLKALVIAKATGSVKSDAKKSAAIKKLAVKATPDEPEHHHCHDQEDN